MKNPLRIVGILVGLASTVIGGTVAAQPSTFNIVNSGSGLCHGRHPPRIGVLNQIARYRLDESGSSAVLVLS